MGALRIVRDILFNSILSGVDSNLIPGLFRGDGFGLRKTGILVHKNEIASSLVFGGKGAPFWLGDSMEPRKYRRS